jgi:hypothetical protein
LQKPSLWLGSYSPTDIVNVSGAVSQWNDGSGNGRHFTQSVSASRPTIDTLNGFQSFLWDGVNDALERAAESWAYVYPVSIFALVRAVAWTNSYNGMFGFYTDSSGVTAGYGFYVKSNGKTAVYTTAIGSQPSYDGTGTATLATGTTHILAATVADNSIASWANGAADGQSSGSWTLRTNLGAGNVGVGSDVRFSRWTNWRIREAIILTGATLDQPTRQRVEGYMAWRAAAFGDRSAVANLTASHPFKNRPPLIGD